MELDHLLVLLSKAQEKVLWPGRYDQDTPCTCTVIQYLAILIGSKVCQKMLFNLRSDQVQGKGVHRIYHKVLNGIKSTKIVKSVEYRQSCHTSFFGYSFSFSNCSSSISSLSKSFVSFNSTFFKWMVVSKQDITIVIMVAV